MLKPWKLVVFVGLSLLLILYFSIYSQLELPASTGAHAVGRTVLQWVDSSRPEVLTEDTNDLREVIAMIWYPAETGTGVRTGYFPNLPLVSDALVQSGEVKWWEVFGMRFIGSESPVDANPVNAEHPFPVMIFSPGNGTNIEFYSSLLGEIASAGVFVSAHPDIILKMGTKEVLPYLGLGNIALHSGEIPEAEKWLSQAREIDAEHPRFSTCNF